MNFPECAMWTKCDAQHHAAKLTGDQKIELVFSQETKTYSYGNEQVTTYRKKIR